MPAAAPAHGPASTPLLALALAAIACGGCTTGCPSNPTKGACVFNATNDGGAQTSVSFSTSDAGAAVSLVVYVLNSAPTATGVSVPSAACLAANHIPLGKRVGCSNDQYPQACQTPVISVAGFNAGASGCR